MFTLAQTIAWILKERVQEEPGFLAMLRSDPDRWVRAIVQEVVGDFDPAVVDQAVAAIDCLRGLAEDHWLRPTADANLRSVLNQPVTDPAAVAVSVRDAELEPVAGQ